MDEVRISPQVLDRMKCGALLYPDSETGEALVGVMKAAAHKNGFPQMVVLETIPPKQAIRQWAMFSQGDDWQASIFNWLNENWEVYRAMRRGSYGKSASTKWDLPLQHLGDWHKQPGGMIAPSSMDFQTAKQFLRDNQQDYLLAPIITFAEEAAHHTEADNTLIFNDVTPAVRVDFWGLGKRDRDFVPLKPLSRLDYGLPRLPDAVWWLNDSERMDLEITALQKDGLNIMDIAQYNADGMPPLETCFALYRPGAYKVILAITPHTYPKKAPLWRLAPIMRPPDGQDLFRALFEASEPVSVPGWSGHEHALIDGVRMIERSLEKK